MSRMAIIAAFAAELGPLVRGWRGESRGGVELWRRSHGGDEWIAACAGAGVNRAARAFAEIERDGAIDLVLSTGWAGALRGELAAGRAYRVSGVIDPSTGERFRATGEFGELWLVTSDRVADQTEKRRLAGAHGAGLVDMEAVGIARLAAMRRIPFYCIKGVSDGMADQLPDFNGFISRDGRFQRARFVGFALLRPWHWLALLRLGENSRRAALALRISLLAVLEQRRAPGDGRPRPN